MPLDTIIYVTNILIGAILACLMTHHWLRQEHSERVRYWMLAAWVMTAADGLFAMRPIVPHWFARFVPTLVVTVGHRVLLLGAQKTADIPRRWRLLAGVVGVHAAGLILFLFITQPSNWRMVFNGFIWASLSLSSAWCFRHAATVFWRPLLAPAQVFLAHGVFHGLRVGSAILFEMRGWTEASAWLQTVGDLEVSLFMVALFVSLLVAHLQLRNEELARALAEVQTLSGLLPICAWCKKIRDDDGYWQKLEDYFQSRSQIKFTHGICAECFGEQSAGRRPVVTRF
jgi:hypothetical protein